MHVVSNHYCYTGSRNSPGVRIHKITIQAMWRIIVPQLLHHIHQENVELREKVTDAVAVNDDIEKLVLLLEADEFRDTMTTFINSKDINFRFWWSYMQMVHTLLLFIRAQRDGNWDLHLYAFQAMLPLFMRYDHTNYARWGTIYVNEMHQLPNAILHEFQSGNFVVKRSARRFNQVDPDQSQEWLNATGKKGGGIIGITKTSSALSRWALSYNLRSEITCNTKEMYNLTTDHEDFPMHSESTKGRQKHDNIDENNLWAKLVALNLFSDDAPHVLQNIMTKDLATEQIGHDLLHASEKGQQQLNTFIDERLLPQEERKVKFRDPLLRNKALTFSSLFDVETKSSTSGKEALKADRSILQRLIIAYQAGRIVNLDDILRHELLPVPIALAEMNGDLRTGSKTILAEVLTADVQCPATLQAEQLGEDATLIIDGQALLSAIGKPQGLATFGDLSEAFINAVLRAGALFHRIDIVFDRYYKVSIKSTTRKRRAKGASLIRRIIENIHVPLPSNWNNFMALSENKADLARFFSEQMMRQVQQSKTIVVSGGFIEEETVLSNNPDIETSHLNARHEEADTRIIVHCATSHASSIVVQARDTDILILLLAHFDKMHCTQLWLKAGTAKKRKYVPVHTLAEKAPYGPTVMETIPAFHALTGSDVTSYLSGHSKKTAWKVFQQYHELLKNLGKGDLIEETIKDAEQFVCRMYKLLDINSVDKARSKLFRKSHTPETLPPTSDALAFHLKRVHYQAALWRQAHLNYPDLPSPQSMGWKLEDDKLVPMLMSLPPVPQSCLAMISCGCTTGCRTLRCKCRKSKVLCTSLCKCSDDSSCHNE